MNADTQGSDAETLVFKAIESFRTNDSSAHELLSKVDFFSRLTISLAAPGALENPHFACAMPRAPGLVALREALRQMQSALENQTFFHEIASIGFSLLATELDSRDSPFKTLDGLRNHLFHGGSLPLQTSSAQIAAVIRGTLRDATSALGTALKGLRIEWSPGSGGQQCLTYLSAEDRRYSLAPLLALSKQTGHPLVFARLTSEGVSLNAPSYEAGRQVFPRNGSENVLRRLFRANPEDSILADFTQAAVEDLEGFKEPQTNIAYFHGDSKASFCWTHADGKESKQRVDQLRVGPDNSWEWNDEGAWVGYSNLLRQISNWEALTSRTAATLRGRIDSNLSTEETFLPLPDGVSAPFISPTIRVGHFESNREVLALESFTERLDHDVESNRGITYLYFVHAEAGTGKTTTLLQMAHRRALDLQQQKDRRLPLFVYVSAKGNVLENLDEAVNASVAETRVITSSGVRALCRNGLAIPIIDGFDELVGSPTYADALASLRPWLQALGGRGVLVISARSSYFLSLYAESIQRETNRDINVRHWLAELDKWTQEQRDQYLGTCGVPLSTVNALPNTERDLLRIPFFARASIEPLRSEGREASTSLLQQLIFGYLRREQDKLRSGTDNSVLVTTEELGLFFEELAAWMMDSETREVALTDMTTIAELSFPASASGEVRNRLAALCGLDSSGEGGRRFCFSHEIFLDFFFGRHIGRLLERNAIQRTSRILAKTRLTLGAARAAFDLSRFSALTLETLNSARSKHLPSDSPCRANLGLLWKFPLFEANGNSLAHSPRVSDAEFSVFDLRSPFFMNLFFERCIFDLVSLGNMDSSGRRRVKFAQCYFQEIKLEGRIGGIAFEDCTIDRVVSSTSMAEERSSVTDLLESNGARLSTDGSNAKESVSGLRQAAQYFLEKIKARIATSIVVNAERMPEEDPRLGWISRRGEEWRKFLLVLEEQELAYFEQISAGGGAKWRVRFRFPPRDLLEPKSSNVDIARFWERLDDYQDD